MQLSVLPDDVILRATDYALNGNDPDRYGILIRFCAPYEKILSVGSAGYEPILTGATHAIDISPLAGDLLKKNGWEGSFQVASCTKLPYEDKEFDCGICSEVIEHLQEDKDVDDTFFELDRVCKNWILTTPCTPVPEPDHKRLLSPEQIQTYAAMYSAQAVRFKIWWFVYRTDRPFSVGRFATSPFVTAKYSYLIPRGMSHA